MKSVGKNKKSLLCSYERWAKSFMDMGFMEYNLKAQTIYIETNKG